MMVEAKEKEIAYLMGYVPNSWYCDGKAGWSPTEPMYSETTLPENLEYVYQVRFGKFLETENISLVRMPDVLARWEILSEGMAMPEGLDERFAVVMAEAIWLYTLSFWNGARYAIGYGSEFKDALRNEAWSMVRGNGRSGGKETEWDEFAQLGYEIGIVYQIKSWLDGVPIELVLEV